MPWREELTLGLRALLGLVLPLDCPECQRPSGTRRPPWCDDCAPRRETRIVHPRPRPGRMPLTVASGEYAGPLRAAVIAYKDGRRELARDFVETLVGLCRDQGWTESCVLVPIPSSRTAVRRRGFDHLQPLVAGIVRELPGLVRLEMIARPPHQRDEQRSALQRRVRLYSLTPAAADGDLTSLPVVLVDDVATSGWTLASAAAALEDSGYEVLGAVVVAAAVLRKAHPNG